MINQLKKINHTKLDLGGVFLYAVSQFVLLVSLLFLNNQENLFLICVVGNLCIFSVIGSNFFFYKILYRINERSKKELQLQLMEKQLQKRLEVYKKVQQNHEHIKKKFHDLKNHMIILDAMNEQGLSDDAMKYLGELKAEEMRSLSS
ncbi:MAG: hypothetical protein R3Y57_06490 [Erysipelotrichaceae bacterium]